MTPSASGLEVTPAILAAPLAPLVGRTSELARVTGLVTSGVGRLVTISGASGAGKTRLALEAAAVIQQAMPVRTVLVGLDQVRDHAGMVHAIARAEGGHEWTGTGPCWMTRWGNRCAVRRPASAGRSARP